MFAVVLFVGFPAAWFNLTAAALAGSYLIMQGAWAMGMVLDWEAYFMVDVAVVALICGKTLACCPQEDFRNAWHQLKCCWTYHTVCDRLILATFVFGVWPAYVLKMPELTRWWLLYGLALVQLLIAAAESLSLWRRAKPRVTEPGTPSSGSLRAAWGTGGGG